MRRTITLDGKSMAYTMRKSKRAKRVSITVHCDGAIVLTTPAHLPERFATNFLKNKCSWLSSKLSYFRRFGGARPVRRRRREYRIHKERARQLALERLAHFNQHYGLRFARVSIRDQKTRWGSCSQKGTLSFNYRLALLPQHLADYVIVHELCHLAHFDHSKAFWHKVAEAIPEYAARKRQLRAMPLR